MQRILIDTDKGPRFIDAEVIGPFAIHPSTKELGSWAITHLFTGLAVTHQAKAWIAPDVARRLNELDDWWFGYLDYQPNERRELRAKLHASFAYLQSLDLR